MMVGYQVREVLEIGNKDQRCSHKTEKVEAERCKKFFSSFWIELQLVSSCAVGCSPLHLVLRRGSDIDASTHLNQWNHG